MVLIRAVALAVLALAAGLGIDAAWLQAKARLAQHLLADSWARARDGDVAPRPWPWADTTPVARLAVPRLGVERIVLAGASGRTLAFGPGHVDGTALPGDPGNAIVGGHRDTSFRFLEQLRAGDRVEVERADGRRFEYAVEVTAIVDAADPWAFEEPASRSTLTLVTCFPFDTPVPGGRQRFVVRAREVG